MKLAGKKAKDFLAKPDKTARAILIYGADAMRVALQRQALCPRLVGSDAERDMRLERLAVGALRKSSAELLDALKAQGFFPGPRLVVLEGVGDGLSDTIAKALAEQSDNDAILLMTAGQLNARSKLRKLIEKHKDAVAIGIYDDPPSAAEVIERATTLNLKEFTGSAKEDLIALGQSLDPGDFEQFLEKLALYKMADTEPLSADDIAQLAPSTITAELDDALNLIAEGQTDKIATLLPRLFSQGQNATGIVIAAQRHFRNLHMATSNPAGIEQALTQMRPPLFGSRKDRMARQARRWGMWRIEQVLQLLLAADRTLRSAHAGPPAAIVERAFIRIAILGARA